ncbi:zf-TFIIB domain-containing protein [Asticcacaulis taihuensis]|uniref:TFIIB-type zinc ribbon-containing protein n=1 Tax=Asticcacaulis taihuensis TaxID=260084 RepID=UPI0026EDFC8E|nr:zf-TFIIB domain-containing protein [Asticcacaulis taihuensis]
MPALICPVCQGSFREVIREGILIDICTQCQGVWLDRGELEKLIALSKEDRDIPLPPPAQPRARRDDEYDSRYEGRDFSHRKKKKSFDFGDIFDFD